MKKILRRIFTVFLCSLTFFLLLLLTSCGNSGRYGNTGNTGNIGSTKSSGSLANFGSSGSSTPRKEIRADLLGTVISITVFDDTDTRVFEEAFSIVSDIDARMSVNIEDSEISKIGHASGTQAVRVSGDTYALIERAINISKLCGGAFDITIAPIMELWKSNEFFYVLPQASEISDKLLLVDYRSILLSEGSVMLAEAGMKLDLGAIAKGYACDSVVEFLISSGVETALLDFGGNIYTYGEKPDGSPWKLGIRSPVIGENDIVCTVTVRDTSVVTSGGYERYFEKDGTIYHHLLNPETGYPADNEIMSVTVINEASTIADALSTACFVLGPERGFELLESLPDTEGIIITKDFNIIITSGLTESVSLTDERFHMN